MRVLVGKYSTYGMAGVGIAAAVGFVFALTILNSNNLVGSGGGNPEIAQPMVETQPNAASSFLFEQNASDRAGGELAASGPALSKQQNEDAAGSNLSQQEMSTFLQESTDLRPSLLSVVSVNGTTGEVISAIDPSSRFDIGKPYFIQAHFINPNDTSVVNHTLVMTLSRNEMKGSTESSQLVEAANFNGDIDSHEKVNLEFYWNPDKEGQYQLVVFSLTSTDLTSGEAREPIYSVSIGAIRG